MVIVDHYFARRKEHKKAVAQLVLIASMKLATQRHKLQIATSESKVKATDYASALSL